MKLKKIFVSSFITFVTLTSVTFASSKIFVDSNQTISMLSNTSTSSFQRFIVFEKVGRYTNFFQTTFNVDRPRKYELMALQAPPWFKNLTLNGQPVPKPFKEMNYKTIPAIPTSLLKKGTNIIQASWIQNVWTQKNEATLEIDLIPSRIDASNIYVQLIAQQPSDLKFQTGPILGCAGKDFFTVSCRLNIPAALLLESNDKKYNSPKALLHTFKVDGLSSNTRYKYTITATIPSNTNKKKTIGPFFVKTLKGGEKFTFAALGDSRTNPEVWGKVAKSLTSKQPEFSIFSGDMITWGLNNFEWDEQFFGPAKDYFSSLPFFAVIGNHEANSPFFTNIFKTPSGGKNWAQKIGTILIIGIDGSMDWEKDGVQTKWLENILVNSEAKFIFLSSHYPAWTSGCHGWFEKDSPGVPGEKPIRLAQKVIMPLMKKYDVTAMIAGHDHFYERSEPDNGVTLIITGGAGAPLRQKVKNSKRQNPYSKVFASTNHYCLFTVDGDTCTMEAIVPGNGLIDTRVWKSRQETFWQKLLKFFTTSP